MEPENIRFGGGSAVTVLHPLVAVVMSIAILSMILLPRKYIVVPAFLALFLIPKGQQIVFAGIHLNVYRIVILAGLARWVTSGRFSQLTGRLNFMDRVVIMWAITYFATDTLLYMQSQATIKNTGDLLDNLGGYLTIRFFVRNREDIRRTIKVLAAIAIVNAACMLAEQRTGANVFSFLGGVPAETVRDGNIRSQGSFAVFITAGTFGATLVPLLVWFSSQTKSRMLGIFGIIASTVMTVTCYASTTLLTYVAGIAALCLWPIRKNMRLVRWGIVVVLVGLHLIMHGPVWSIIEHIDLTGSSSSYHRYMLIDTFIRHFSDWWLVGTKDNGSWGWDMWDASDQYVAYGFSGGLLTFLLFLTIISKAFGRVGKARKIVEGNRREEWFLWCLGATVFSHVVGFFGIGYFDQMQFAWFTLLAIISVAVSEATEPEASQIEQVIKPSYPLHATI
jgi:hypothetical protein